MKLDIMKCDNGFVCRMEHLDFAEKSGIGHSPVFVAKTPEELVEEFSKLINKWIAPSIKG